MLQTFLQYILPAIIGAVSAVIGVWLTTRVQNRQVTETDDATLRQCLMQERKQLVSEIETLQKRCDALETTNREQAEEMSKLKEQNRKLVAEIKHFGSGLPDEET